MANEFYALMGRMRYITRWGLMRNTFSENISEHSHMTAVLARYHPVKREIHSPPSGNMILAVTKSKRSNIPSPKTVNPFMTPNDNEQNIPRKTQPPVTNLAAFPRERLNSS